MNILTRAITAQKLILSHHHHSRKCLFSPQPITAFQQFSRFSTTNHQTNNTRLRTHQPRKSRTQKPSSESSSSSSSYVSWSQRVKEQAEKLPKWPKPSEIPFQAKVANSVNLIGVIQMPVQFHATPDGKHLAATFLAQENATNSGLSLDSLSAAALSTRSLMIPVVFEGDLAHIVACHVKQNDCVYVTGKLCVDPLPFVLSDDQGRFHVLGQEINFVQGFERRVARRGGKDFDSVGNENGGKEVVGFERKDTGELGRIDEFTPLWVYKKLESLKFDDKVVKKSLNDVETIKDGDYDDKIDHKSLNNVGTTKDGDSVFNSWRDLVRNPKDWWDNRERKSKGLVKPKYPDFTHKTSGTALWLNKAPNWALPGLQGLEFDVQVRKGKRANGGKEDDHWKSLVENPDKWWDNRLGKKNKRAPDFKHKETGEGLWLNSSPDWVSSRLPPLKDDQTGAAGMKSTAHAI